LGFFFPTEWKNNIHVPNHQSVHHQPLLTMVNPHRPALARQHLGCAAGRRGRQQQGAEDVTKARGSQACGDPWGHGYVWCANIYLSIYIYI